jgi:hypothetical protein
MKKENTKREIKLKTIANISSGLVLARVDSSQSDSFDDNIKKYYYISQKSVKDNYIEDNEFEPIYTNKNIEKRYLAQYKDIIMKLTQPYNAAVIDFQRDDVIVPSNFAIIRIKEDYVSVFLAYILNGEDVRRQLKRLVEGSNIPVIKINSLKNINIKKVSKHKQIEYSKLFYLIDYRRKLLDRARELEDNLRKDILSKL